MTADDAQVYTLHDLTERTAEVIEEIREAGKPAFITAHGRFIAVITPLEPGQVEQQALAAIARALAPTQTTETGETK